MKKKLVIIIASIVLSIICILVIDSTYSKSVAKNYFGKVGDIITVEKNQGLVLNQEAIKTKDNVFIFGSSELSGGGHPFHPSEFFNNKKYGFQVNLVGRGYCQSIIHTLNFGALGSQLKDQKVVFIISPQWFAPAGLTSADFIMNFSELQFYKFMSNNKIPKNVKENVANRINQLAGNDKDLNPIKKYCSLYNNNSIFAKTELAVLKPYYAAEEYKLSLKDKVVSSKVLLSKEKNKDAELASKNSTNIDWQNEKNKAEQYAKDKANNNDFMIENSYYDKYIKDKVNGCKGNYYSGASYLKSPEYEDLRLLLEVCKGLEIKPLFVSVPVHGKWYDYAGFDKQDRLQYYSNIKELINSYKYELADLSQYEYEDYFLKDVMHLGWKGWVYVDEAIYKYYYSNK